MENEEDFDSIILAQQANERKVILLSNVYQSPNSGISFNLAKLELVAVGIIGVIIGLFRLINLIKI